VSLEELGTMALAGNPELIAARQQVERAEAELAVAKQEYKPDFSVQGGYMVMPNQTDGLMVQGAITWTRAPWSRRKLDLHVQEMTAQVEAARAREIALGNEGRLAVKTAFVRAKTAEQRASLLRTTILPQSDQTLDISRIGYQSGQGEVVGILDTQRMLLASRLDYYKSLGEFQKAVADLEQAVGRDITPVMVPDVHGVEVMR
jgi:cobalt-zinc-cadmium efflux system outer membrane protein